MFNIKRPQLFIVAVLILIIVILTFLFGYRLIGGKSLSIMLVTVAVVTFFGFLNEAENVDERSMRRAIAASVVMVYLVLLATVIFWVEIPGDPKTKLPDVTQTMLTHFTTIMGVVIAFYFGASAYIDKK